METRFQVRSFDSPLTPEAFSRIPRCPIFVILDNLRSAFNVGSIIRTADCTLVERIYFCGITAHPPNTKLDKTALGALSYLSWEHRKTVEESVVHLKGKGIPVVALETTDKSRTIWEYQFPLPVGLILGNEALGVSQAALRLVDDVVEIPMLGYKNSINVAVAFGIAAYEIQRQYWNQLAQNRQLKNQIEITTVSAK